MKYVALLSGGKDSCFNLLHCQKNGHELVAAASLRPQQGKDEIDSYMYQTVGQDAIETVAKALDVPLYRRVIKGDAVHQGSEYGARKAHGTADLKGDETEDLYELLQTVLEHHPEIKGVSVGAILSNYQRVRVEHVCRRLGLTSLAYLWQRDQGGLLDEMIEAGLTAVLIKVAGIGLTVKHLGKTLQEMQPTLRKLNSLYGSHICGEGGEYETLTIDSPMFKSKIVLKEVETVIHSDNDFATVAYLRVKNAELEPKPANEDFELPIPPLLEEKYEDIVAEEESEEPSSALASLSLDGEGTSTPQHDEPSHPMQSQKVGHWVSVTNIQRSTPQSITIEEEVTHCFQLLKDELQKYGLEIHHCANINILLSSMDLFASVNAVYGTFFGTSPPARACVSVALPDGVRVRLDVLAFAETEEGERQAHHVQGLSYWAPANIGPYSQAILAQERVFVSGQIGLVPRNLVLAESLQTQAALASQHAERIIDALASNTGSNWKPSPLLNIWWFEKDVDLVSVRKSKLVEMDGDVPSLFVTVSALPKGARVEKQVFLHTGRTPDVVDEDEDEFESAPRVGSETPAKTATIETSTYALRTEQSVAGPSTAMLVFGRGVLSGGVITDLPNRTGTPYSVRLFHRLQAGSLARSQSALKMLGLDNVPVTDIPCRTISSRTGNTWDYAICILSTSNDSISS